MKRRDLAGEAMRIVLFGEYSTALSAADCLRGYPITVAGLVDEPRLASLSRFVENRIVLPGRSVEQAVRCLESLKQKTGEKLLLFPCADIWMETLAEDLPRVLRIGPMLPATAGHLSLTLDKSAFGQAVTRLGLPLPATLCENVSQDWTPPSYPFVLKPSSTYRLEAQYGVKAVVIKDPREWEAFDKQLLAKNAFLAQEYAEGASLSVCFCTTSEGRLAASYCTEKVHYGSMRTGSRVAVVTRPDAIELASEFVRRTGFVGFGELEMIEAGRGLLLLELNARPWGQVVMSRVLGVPILETAVALMSGRPVLDSAEAITTPLEWISWDKDLLYRRAMWRQGRAIRPPLASQRVYAQSFLRDPVPALVHALKFSPVGPARLLRRQ